MTSLSQSTIPFTKQALQAIFNRYAPSFSCETNITSHANLNLSSGSDIRIDENYVWSNKQHITTNRLYIYHDKMLFIKDTYHPDISKIYFIEIMDQDITLNDIGYIKSFTIDKLNHQDKCTNAKYTYKDGKQPRNANGILNVHLFLI